MTVDRTIMGGLPNVHGQGLTKLKTLRGIPPHVKAGPRVAVFSYGNHHPRASRIRNAS